MELAALYRQMARARAFEFAVADLWQRGLISGEMHLGTGEEAVAAGVVTHLRDGDGLSLAHRGSPPLVVRGVPLVPLLQEYMGQPGGLCRGRGGHMHVFSREHLAATSGIVGASAPLGAGFALAVKHKSQHGIAVALTGDGAMNQGMLLETLNLAATWHLPLLLVCIDNGWAITTRAGSVTAGELGERAEAFAWAVKRVDGGDVERVHHVAGQLVERCRAGKGPAFLLASCPRLDGHFLGDALLGQARHLTSEDARQTLGQVVSAAVRGPGASPVSRAVSVGRLLGTLKRARGETMHGALSDPLSRARFMLERSGLAYAPIDVQVEREVDAAVQTATQTAEGSWKS